MSGARSFFWAASSVVVALIGAFGPWATKVGLTVDGSDDELTAIAALVAALALVVFSITRNRKLTAIPLLAGLISVVLVGHDLTDPAGPFGGPGPNIHLSWGIWTALAGSVGMALASLALFAETARVAVSGRRPDRLRTGANRQSQPALRRKRGEVRRRFGPRSPEAKALVRDRKGSVRDPHRARMREFWSLAPSCTPYVAAEHRDGVFIVPTLAHRKFFLRGDPKDAIALGRAVEVLRQRGQLKPHSTIVDVGAHIGTTSITAVNRHGFERAVAIEPDPYNLRVLRANIALNGLHERVNVIPGAVSGSAGRRHFLPGSRGGVGAFLWTKGRLADGPSPDTIPVEAFTLDGLCKTGLVDPATTGLVWLDCQKQEVEALLYASAFVERRVPIVFVLRRAGPGNPIALSQPSSKHTSTSWIFGTATLTASGRQPYGRSRSSYRSRTVRDSRTSSSGDVPGVSLEPRMVIGAKSFWWAVASLPLMIVGALSPWARAFGGRVDGSGDEVVLVLAILAAFILFVLAASDRRWLVVIPLLTGLTAAALAGNDINDIADFAPRVSAHFVSVQWGIYLALFGSTSLVLASVLLFIETAPTRAVRTPRGRWLASRLVRTEIARRKAFVAHAASFTPFVAVETNEVTAENQGTLFFLPTRQKAGRDRFMKGEWKENRHLQRALDALENVGVEVPRRMFVDVGAHIGTTTIAAVRRFGFESAIAFEPEPGNFRLLRTNLVFNGLETRIQTLNVAVSNRIGRADLKVRPSMGSKQRLLRGDEVAANSIRVPLTTLDALVEDGSLDPAEASLLWLDIEGHELEALQGASTLIARSVPIVMEFIPRELRRDGRLEALRSLLHERYTHVLDLRLAPKVPDLRPLRDLPKLAEHYKRGFTDLLVFRLPNA